ncbi:MAG: hypothetical protein HYY36_07735 [Gammaproteobacteria bacterium]|nr:hypothetical protein [Gammaproteobacteria bacterium]
MDPSRVERVFNEFDERRGYHNYHDFCQARFTRTIPEEKDFPLADSGFQVVEVMDRTHAGHLLERAVAESRLGFLKRDTRKLKGYRIQDQTVMETLFSSALPARVDALAARFFRSEYLIHWFTLSRTAPGKKPASVSFQWHCDKGPRAHLKLLVYLNDAEEHGGGTAFVSLRETAQLAKSGYLFGRGRRRSTDLAYLSRLAGCELHPHACTVRAGEGILFQPARVLHSGITPSRGHRFVLTLCLLPSPVHWKKALRCGTLSDLTREPLWHAHASELAQEMGFGTGETGLRPDPA